MENTQQKQDDPLNKYSFSSYHMNIISGNNHVQTTPTGPSPQMRENQFMNYSYQPHYQQPNHYVPNDLQLLINNMFTVLNNQSKLLSYLIEKNDHNFFTTNKIYSELKTIKYAWSYLERKKSKSLNHSKSIWRNLTTVAMWQQTIWLEYYMVRKLHSNTNLLWTVKFLLRLLCIVKGILSWRSIWLTKTANYFQTLIEFRSPWLFTQCKTHQSFCNPIPWVTKCSKAIQNRTSWMEYACSKKFRSKK